MPQGHPACAGLLFFDNLVFWAPIVTVLVVHIEAHVVYVSQHLTPLQRQTEAPMHIMHIMYMWKSEKYMG